jgi:hypothetical protein
MRRTTNSGAPCSLLPPPGADVRCTTNSGGSLLPAPSSWHGARRTQVLPAPCSLLPAWRTSHDEFRCSLLPPPSDPGSCLSVCGTQQTPVLAGPSSRRGARRTLVLDELWCSLVQWSGAPPPCSSAPVSCVRVWIREELVRANSIQSTVSRRRNRCSGSMAHWCHLPGSDYSLYYTCVKSELCTLFNKYDLKFGAVRQQLAPPPTVTS